MTGDFSLNFVKDDANAEFVWDYQVFLATAKVPSNIWAPPQ